MAAAAIPLMAIGTGMKAFGAYQEGQAKAAAHRYNAQKLEEDAELALKKGAEEERRVRVMGRKVLGDMRASYAASGISGGSALDVLADSASAAEMDALTVRNDSQTRARQLRNDAAMERRGVSTSQTAGYVSAGATLLGGAADIAGRA